MRIVIATTQVPFVRGGAELHAENLRDALQAGGHEAEIVAIPFKWYPAEKLLDMMLASRLLDLTECSGVRTDVLIGLKFPAYYIQHPNKVLWILHQHRAAYDLWGHDFGDLHRFPNGVEVRAAIEHADRKLIPEARAVFANSRNVAERLKTYCGIESQPLYHPPPNAGLYRCAAQAEPYLFFPSRLNRVKRQWLVLEALTHTRHPVEVRFSGISDERAYPRELEAMAKKLEVGSRVQWLGQVSEEQKIDLFARALGILYPPVNEDYGYVTLEAMLASKPLITCSDSGGPLELVQPGKTGLIAEPTPEALAAALDRLWEDSAYARQLGEAGRDSYSSLKISWANVVEKLLEGARR